MVSSSMSRGLGEELNAQSSRLGTHYRAASLGCKPPRFPIFPEPHSFNGNSFMADGLRQPPPGR